MKIISIIGTILVFIAIDILLDVTFIKLASKGKISLPLRFRKPAQPPLPVNNRIYLRYDNIESQKFMDRPGYDEHSYPVDGDSVVIDYEWLTGAEDEEDYED